MASSADGRDAREVAVRPINARPRRRCCIASGSRSGARYVAKASGGRLGYVHMFDMGAGSLAQLYVDLDAENHARDGVVDRCAPQQRRLRQRVRDRRVRATRLHDNDAARRRGSAGAHGARPARARRADGARDGPAFAVRRRGFHGRLSHAQARSGGRGADVGMDHLHVEREPDRRIVAAHPVDGDSGQRRESHGDEPASRSTCWSCVPVGESYTGRDSQLDAAVRELLKIVGTKTAGTRQ